MKQFVMILIIVICGLNYTAAQTEENAIDTIPDVKYLEDQFYVGLTYNIIQNRPREISQNNLSNGLHIGFIKDIPINKRRNKAFGIGLGYSFNSYFHNLKATETSAGIAYEALGSENAFKKNKYTTHIVEVPIEFRWRTSTAKEYKFWRVYGGIKFGYLLSGISKFEDNNGRSKFSNPDFNKLQYGLTLSAGYNTWNFYAYYGLNKLFKSNTTTVDGEKFEMNAIKVGLMFYIL